MPANSPFFSPSSYVWSTGVPVWTDDFTILVDRNFGQQFAYTAYGGVNGFGPAVLGADNGVFATHDDNAPQDISPQEVAREIMGHIRQNLQSNNRVDPWVEFGIATAEVIFSVAAIATGAGALAVAGRAASIAIKGGIFLEANNLAGTGLRYIGVPLHSGAAGEVYNPLVAATRHLGNATGLHQEAANLEMAIHSLNLCMAFGYSTKVKALSAVGTSGTAALVMNHYEMTQKLVDAYEQDANFTDQID